MSNITSQPPPFPTEILSIRTNIGSVNCQRQCNFAVLQNRSLLIKYDINKNKSISYTECITAYIDFINKKITETQYTTIWYFYVCGCKYI